ncbi:MAG TPA: helix-turn-helix domain-containing protein [Thermoleophilaceae bacterium]|jgi:transcriptional regulator with XRE-family HTH domain
MGTPAGDFIRAKRDSLQPESLGLPERERRRAPGVRRSDLAARAGISVEYLTRIEQGRHRNPSASVISALADAMSLDPAESEHLRYLVKITGGACSGHERPEPPSREVRPDVLATLRLLEPAVACVTNRLGDVLAWTDAFEVLMAEAGLLDSAEPNLTSYVFTDPRAREFFPDWDRVADEQVFDLWLGPSAATSEWFRTELAPAAGKEFTKRFDRHVPPPRAPLHVRHPGAGDLRWNRETLELSRSEAQQIVVFLPADDATTRAMEELSRRSRTGRALRAVT